MPAISPVLLDHPALWRGGQCAPVAATVASGFAPLDLYLPGGGWPQATLTELSVATPGIGELALLMPACARLTQAGRRVIFIDPPHLPYAPALADAGVDLARLLLVRTASRKDRLWALEQSLKSALSGAVLAWPGSVDDHSLRRLQLACEQGGGSGFLFAPAAASMQSSVVALRLSLSAAGDGRLAVRILKRRGSLVLHPIVLDPRPS